MKRALVCGAGGFIGSHLVKRLKQNGYWVRAVDLHYPDFAASLADEFLVADLRDPDVYAAVFNGGVEEVYQLAADMGGAGFVFTGEHDADILHNNAIINLNVLKSTVKYGWSPRIFFSSSACIYPAYNQKDPSNPMCSEWSAYPAEPDSDYGFEKLFSERLYMAFARNYDLEVRIARYHNIFGPEGTYEGGREKAPAAFCRKVAMAPNGGEIEMWGDGEQTRSFLYIDDCIDGTLTLMASEWNKPINIGSEEMVTINDLAKMVMRIAGKDLTIKHIPGPLGVRGRNSDNHLVREVLGWEPRMKLVDGLEPTYSWILSRV